MATTAFWPVYNHLKETIDYAKNPDKTIERKYVDEDLYKTLQYAENSDKTDETMYVSAVNCPKQKAYEYMMRTKRRFHESGKIQFRYSVLKSCMYLGNSFEYLCPHCHSQKT